MQRQQPLSDYTRCTTMYLDDDWINSLCSNEQRGSSKKTPHIDSCLSRNVQDDRRSWQELGVEAPRFQVKERLGSVLEGAKDANECNATTDKGVRKANIN